MAIAGVEPVELTLFSKFGIKITADTNGMDMYTSDQVREILERFDEWVQVVGNDDVDGFMENEESWSDEGSRNATLKLIAELRKTYGPEIEMTQDQKNAFDLAKQTLETSKLASVVEGQGPSYSKLDELSGRVWGHKQGEATDEQIKKTMQAWLHPELITVI
ncbi:hypothetical protein KGP40_04390 [Weissella cibaria]|uniref:hypothetical protein n=1 Tax=Weissella cibaria TaxID=137591 RepID=UPI001C1F9D74|nr:hypothetical protein [Weissella cibaria]MBU7561154.1 hypothetical protein [Weissella cibaria]